MNSCKYFNFFVSANVVRLEDIGRFTVDLKITCDQCGAPMRFIGLPLGVDLNGAAVSADGIEARLAIHPAGEAVPGLPDDAPAGFRILNRGQQQ